MSGMSEPTTVDISALRVRRAGRVICHVPALSVQTGERIGIVGPNGSGKTTLLRVLAGFEPAIDGVCRVAVTPHERVFVHQAPRLFRGSVLRNVAYGLSARGIPRPQHRTMVLDWLRRVGLDGFADRDAATLSGGEIRRVAVARACILQPALLLLDEPFADLDPSGISHIQAAIAALPDCTVLIASPTPLPEPLSHRAVTLRNCQTATH